MYDSAQPAGARVTRRRCGKTSWTICVALGVLSGGIAYLEHPTPVASEDGPGEGYSIFTDRTPPGHGGRGASALSLLQLRNPAGPVSSGRPAPQPAGGGASHSPGGAGEHAEAPGGPHRRATIAAALPAAAGYSGLAAGVVAALCGMQRAMREPAPAATKSDSAAPTAAVGAKQLYLVTAPGFILQVFLSMSIFFSAALVASRLPALRNACPYHTAVELLMAKQKGLVVAVWSVFGLFSSSCCAIQLFLNVFNVGCAGFNTVLGPWRPVFIGLTATLQITVWAHVYLNPHMWPMAAVGTFVAVSLSFLPEILHLLARLHAPATFQEASLTLHVEGMGCAACTNAVHAICAEMSRKDERVGGCAVLFEEQLVRCAWVGGKDSTDSRSAVADDLCRRLSDAGFSARPAL